MPETTPLVKIQSTRRFGATVELHGRAYDEAAQRAAELASEQNLVYVHPFDDLRVMAGQGTLGLEIIERTIDRSEIYVADECFLTGTAAHLSPVIEIDRRRIGSGGVGPVTAKLQSLFFDVIRGRNAKYASWVRAVPAGAKAKAGAKA